MKKFIAYAVVFGLILSGFFFNTTGALAQAVLTAVINTPSENQSFSVNQAIGFSGGATGGNATFYGYLWDFGDGTVASATTFNKIYTTAGVKNVTLTVTDASGAQALTTRHITITGGASPSAPTVDLLVNGGNGPITVATGTAATISWTSANATACTASGAWSGSKGLTGSESTGALNTVGSLVYTITCSGASASATDSVTINVSSGGGGGAAAPVISNIFVDGQTQTSAVIHWTTNIPADSRVIYDTVSHSTLGAAPNYGYAFSSPTTDTSPKVTTHAVTLTGLTANTQYFFRVLSQS